MKMKYFSVVCLAALASQAGAQSLDLQAKQLAGPPEEFEMMQPADAVANAVSSKAALIPVSFDSSKQGNRWRQSIPMDSANARVLLLKSSSSDWDFKLAESGKAAPESASSRAVVHTQTTFGMQDANVPAELFAFENLKATNYSVEINSNDGAEGFLLVEGDDATQLQSYPLNRQFALGQPVTILARLQNSDARAAITAASLNVTSPSGEKSSTALHDDGQHNDGAAGDGLYGATFSPVELGDYRAQVLATGAVGDRSLIRSAEHVIPVIDDQIVIANSDASLKVGQSAGRLALSIPMVASKAAQHYRVYAQVWGSDARGREIPVAWVSTMAVPSQGAAYLELDQRWIAKSGASAPFSLREVRVEDPDHFITLASADRINVRDAIAPVDVQRNIEIDEAMRMGVRPAALNSAERGTGSRLLLVHGYCSNSVWPAAQFSNASVFLDTNQNRSNDQFAQRIKTFGNTWNSYGVVAHSQGGMASLHLYNYYWSGLDNATGARLIQSVGTPYQGTNLAGVLAALGGIFGVGCGTQNDLTYSGASSWLAGISSTSRAKVNFYTTAFKTTNWWTNDYCNFASDLVLSDPEDGTTEKAKGQLSGGVNRGHVDGQCHTAGMRDPAQYNDAGRNSVMNSNAAR